MSLSVSDTPKKGNVNDEIILYGLKRMGGESCSASPYVTKLQTFLIMADLPYTAMLAFPPQAPKKRLPFIKHGDNVIGDSTFVIKYLLSTYGDGLKVQAAKDPKKAAVAHTVERLVENELVSGLAYGRLIDEKGFQHMKNTFIKKSFPYVLRPVVARAFRNGITDVLTKQGLIQHSKSDMFWLLDNSLKAVSEILGDQKYITGDTPVPQDATLFAFLDLATNDGFHYELYRYLEKYPNLVQYQKNFQSTYFPYGPAINFPHINDKNKK